MALNINKTTWVTVAGVFLLTLGGLAFYSISSHKSTTTRVVSPVPPVPAKPGASGNSGDAAKSSVPTSSPQNTVAPRATPSPTGGIQVSIDSLTPRSDGTLRVANTVLGASSGSCLLELTDPTGLKTNFSGTIITSGTSLFCSLESITGVTKSGTWSAKLTATSSALSGYQSASFKKE